MIYYVLRAQHMKATYGGEVELLSISAKTGKLSPVSEIFLERIEKQIATYPLDTKVTYESGKLGYDSSAHLVEIGTGVHMSLAENVKYAIFLTQQVHQGLQNHGRTLLAMSTHPTDDPEKVYKKNVIKKAMYKLWRGTAYHNNSQPHRILEKIYTSKWENGRGWKHHLGTMSASIQPWNSVSIINAVDQLSLIQATGWMFNLLTANSPFHKGQISGKRDYRLEMWHPKTGMLSTSRYRPDRLMTENLSRRPRKLVDYYYSLMSRQRPMAIPNPGPNEDPKKSFLPIIQPPDSQRFTVLELLKQTHIHVIDLHTEEMKSYPTDVSLLLNRYYTMYYPRFGARLRIHLPHSNQIDSRAFAESIEKRNNELFLTLLKQAGIEKEGFLCIEGRVASTNIPSRTFPSWQRFAIPFILQTALIRSHAEIWQLLEQTPLNWIDLAHTLPEITNTIGFSTQIKGITAKELATAIWKRAKQSLFPEELALIGNTIETILQTQKGPAEEQVDWHKQHYNQPNIFKNLIRQFRMTD